MLNGQIHEWNSAVQVWTGDYLKLCMTQSSEHLRSIIGSPLTYGDFTAMDMPAQFSHQALQHAMEDHVQGADFVDIQAIQLQLALSWDARSIYLETRQFTLTDRAMALFTVTEEPTTYTSLLHNVHRDPFGLYHDLLSRHCISYHEQWKVFTIHPSVSSSALQVDYPVVGLLAERDLERPLDQLVFTEVQTHGLPAFPPEWRLVLLPPRMQGWDLLNYLGKLRICEEHHCTLMRNARPSRLQDPLQTLHGDFLQLHVHLGTSMQHEITIRVPADDCQPDSISEEPSSATNRDTSTSNTYTSGHPPSMPPGMSLQLLSWFFVGSLINSRFRVVDWKRRSTPCPCDRWCVGSSAFRSTSHLPRFWLIFLVLSLPLAQALMLQLPTSGRVGEATHPGPTIHIGTSNPSGLRGKEFQYKELPEGIWGVSETHVSAHSMRSIGNQMRQATTQPNAYRFFQPGAPIPLRARSTTEGGWSGVAFLTDLVPRDIKVHWPAEEYGLGRAQMCQFWCGAYPITGINLYLWPKSPTWPRALEASKLLLETVTRELIYGRAGPRFVTGDFNHRMDQLPVLSQWREQGWIEIQELAFLRQGRIPTPTYRGITAPDQVWISPELAEHFVTCDTWSLFADHLTLGARFELPVQRSLLSSWPLPAELPWHQLDMETWHRVVAPPQLDPSQTLSQQYLSFWRQYEASTDGLLTTPSTTLPSNHCGRASRITPDQRTSQCPLLRPSRPGEAQMATDLVGRSVQAWFKQLRRIQSLLHAVRANKTTGEAQIYRANLWKAIRRASGFAMSFSDWWHQRPIRLQGSPLHLSPLVPSLLHLEAIWEDFHSNYRKLESWHVRRRRELLTAHMEANHNRLFQHIKPPAKHALTHLQECHSANVIGVSEDGQQIQVDTVLPQSSQVHYQIDDRPATLQFETEDQARIDYDGLCEVGSDVLATVHYSTFADIDTKLRSFWEKRWIRDCPSESDWERILSFTSAYLPRIPEGNMPLDVESWTEINKRYTARSARGPDGVSRRDLQCMPLVFKEALVSLLQQCEQQTDWPESLTTGFVYPLPKRADSQSPGDFRPVIIYSMVYRSWSSHRARRLLRQLQHLTSSRQFGFMPETDAAEMWLMAQALIETACQQNVPLHGYVTDIQKAFENLPREPIRQLAKQLGAPQVIIDLWFAFLNKMQRRFVIAGQIGEALTSNHGLPEGCGLSCYAMSLVDISFHYYFHAYSSRTVELSYVDNLELMTFTAPQLQQGIVCLQTWLDLWALQLDTEKSYIWATTAAARSTLKVLGWRISTTAKDLGAPMAYGKGSASSISGMRLQSLNELWPLLSRSMAPQWQKEKILRTALWPRAFYGGAISTISQDNLCQLRSDAMRAIGHRRAGASPAVRLFLLCHPQCDPGYYHAWHAMQTFRRVAAKRPILIDLDRIYGCICWPAITWTICEASHGFQPDWVASCTALCQNS